MKDLARLASRAAALTGREIELALIIEGLTQTWPLHGKAAVESAKQLGRMLQGAV
jgi:DNA-binding CsgD family transcriptional regulator